MSALSAPMRVVIAMVLTGVVAGPAVTSSAVAVMAHASTASSRSSAARTAIPQPVYFWNSTVAVIRGPGQLPAREVIRPSRIMMFADGSWAIIHLRWTGWGTSVAHGTGTSSASNGIPNQAEGKRIKRPAKVALSHPRQFRGREVYRCFTLTIRSHPASDQHLCLTRIGRYWYLSPMKLYTPIAFQADGQVRTTCMNDGRNYIFGKTAAARGNKAKFVGTFARFHPCGDDGGYFTGNTRTITLTLTTASKITVFKNELLPDFTDMKTVTAAHFPRWFRKNKDQPIYQYSGRTSAVKRLTERFVS